MIRPLTLPALAVVLCACAEPREAPPLAGPNPALADTLLTLFDSLTTVHQATPDLALLARIHSATDTIMFVEGSKTHHFTGDSLVQRVAAAHVGVSSMGPSITDRSALMLGADHAILTGRELVHWTDRAGVHEFEGLITIVVVRSTPGGRWVIRGYRM